MKTDERGVKVSLSSTVDGFLPWKFVEETSGDARALFKNGMGIRVQVVHVDEAERRVILTRQGVSSDEGWGREDMSIARGNVNPSHARVVVVLFFS